MKNSVKFYKCDICGNVIYFVSDSGNAVTCCQQQMKPLKENATDASQEKHVPVAALSNNELTVTVGAAEHPMAPEHHIDWVAAVQGDKIQIVTLEHTAQPKAKLTVAPGDVKVYEYCNLHGLWSTDVKAQDAVERPDKHTRSNAR